MYHPTQKDNNVIIVEEIKIKDVLRLQTVFHRVIYKLISLYKLSVVDFSYETYEKGKKID